MPTGYTAAIENGDISFEKFVMLCARAFGACVTMRDESFDKPIPEEFKPSPFYAKEVEKSKKEIFQYTNMKVSEAANLAKIEYEKEVKENQYLINKNLALKKKYEDMLEKVKAWEPPSSDHIGLKNFMIEQIKSSIDFDCNIEYYKTQKFKLLSGKEYKEKKIKEAKESLEYDTNEFNKENERVARRNEWIKQLRESLKKK